MWTTVVPVTATARQYYYDGLSGILPVRLYQPQIIFEILGILFWPVQNLSAGCHQHVRDSDVCWGKRDLLMVEVSVP